MTFQEVLARAASRSQVALPDRVLTGCAAHFALLLRWNRVHNLAGFPAKATLVSRAPLADLRTSATIAVWGNPHDAPTWSTARSGG